MKTSNSMRAGVSLVEVLVAIFVMALGLLALLTLFPLGALSMAQSLRDDRTATVGTNGSGVFRAFWKQNNLGMTTGEFFALPAPPPGLAPPNPTPPPVNLEPRSATPRPDLVSYPVYFDPLGFLEFGTITSPVTGNWRDWLAGGDGQGGRRASVPRVNIAALGGFNNIVSMLAGLDEITFGSNGSPASTSQVERELRYSWAVLAQLPSCTNTNIAQMSVIVYSGRSLQSTSLTSGTGETLYGSVALTQGSRNLSITYTGAKPDIRPGRWLLVSRTTYWQAPALPGPYAQFYRIVGVEESPVGTLNLELETPLRVNDGSGNVIILDNVIEVFDMGVVVS